MVEVGLPLVGSPREVQAAAASDAVLIVDLGTPEQFAEAHVPGAVQLDFTALLASSGATGGLLPPASVLTPLFAKLGLSPGTHVVAYDRDGGGKAARCIWTLHAMDFVATTLLDGGLDAWRADGLPVQSGPADVAIGSSPDLVLRQQPAAIATTEWILAHLGDPDVVMLDARTPAEFAGRDRRALRAGHIPGAVNWDWLNAMDPDRQRRFRPAQALRAALAALGVAPDREVVVYCQTHHRSSHTYVGLRHCGFERVRGYPGAWSEWGNLEHTPVA